jgi:hypothetical protein
MRPRRSRSTFEWPSRPAPSADLATDPARRAGAGAPSHEPN